MRVSRDAAHQITRPATRPPTSSAETVTSHAHAVGLRRLIATAGASSMTLIPAYGIRGAARRGSSVCLGGGRRGATGVAPHARRGVIVERREEPADDLLELADRVRAEQHRLVL